MLIDIDNWKPSEGISLPDEVLNQIVKETSRNIAILAGPGTGKTELLAQRASFLLETGQCPFPQKILALCFKVDAAANIKERVQKRCGNLANSRFISLTFDSFFISIVRRFSCFLPNWINDLSADFEVGAFTQIRNLPVDLNTITDISIQQSLNNCISQNKLHWSTCRSLAYTIIKYSNEVKRLISLTYKFVFLDEFQDTTTLQYEFIKEVFNIENNIITTVGDNNQMIMGWAGADLEVFNKFAEDFNANKKTLNINHRSNKNIVDLINFISESIKEEGEDAISYQATREASSVHSIFAVEFDTKQDEAAAIAAYINKIINENPALSFDNLALVIRQRAVDYFNIANIIFSENNLTLRNEDEVIIQNGLKIQDLMDEPISEFFINILRKQNNLITPEQNKLLIKVFSSLKNYDIENERKYKKLIDELNEIISLVDNHDKTNLWTNKIIRKIGRENFKRIRTLSNEADFTKVKMSFDALFQESFNKTKDIQKAISLYKGEGQVKLMTVHKSKGLEFDTVFFVDFNANAWWGLGNAISGNDTIRLKEEQNTFFVGASRAKEKLIFTNGHKGQWPPVITTILNESAMIQQFNP